MSGHFVSASCEGELCSVCKAPATHKLGEEIPHDEPCMTCGGTWKDVSDEDGLLSIPPPPGPVCGDFYHHCRGVPRHNLTAYVCCAHFKMIVGLAAGCPDVRCKAWRMPTSLTWALSAPGNTMPPAALQCTKTVGHTGLHVHPSFRPEWETEHAFVFGRIEGKIRVCAVCNMSDEHECHSPFAPLFRDAVKIRDRALEIHRHGAPHSQLAMVVFDLAELVAAMARGDK